MIGADAEQLGVMSAEKAIALAEEIGLDLVEIAPTAKPPACRIMDYSKYKYEQEKKERQVKKKAHVTHLKQIRIKPQIEENDYQTKLKKAIMFLEKRDKVKVNLFFAGRQMAFRDKGRKILQNFIVDIEEYGQVEKDIQQEGRVMSVMIAPKAEKK